MSLKGRIEELIGTSIEQEGFELIELKLSQYRKNSGVRVFIDSDNGVQLDDCARVSRAIGIVLDDSGLFRDGYTLEVSSPGLDRPLHTMKDFKRRIGELVRIFFDDAGMAPVEGELIAVDEQEIELKSKDGSQKLELAGIRMGKIIL